MSSTEALQPDRDAVLYLIDASPSMREQGTFAAVVDAVVGSIKQVQRQTDRHFDTGVIIYNIANSDMKNIQFSDIKVALSINNPTVADLRELQAMADEEADEEGSDTIYSEPALINALQQAKLELALLKQSTFRRLVIITDNDKPCRDGELHHLQALTHDLVEMNILIAPMFLENSQKPFDSQLQWAKLVYLPPFLSRAWKYSNLSVSMEPYNIDELGTDLVALVQSKAERKPTAFRGTMKVASLEMGITAYKIVTRSQPLRSHYIARSGGATTEVRTESSLRFKDSRKIADGSSIHRKFVLGTLGEVPLAPFEFEELEMLRQYSFRSRIELLCFCSAESLPFYGLTSSSMLIVPSNHELANSKKAFASLRRSMIRQKKVAYVNYFPKNNHKPAVNGIMYAYDPSPKLSDSQEDLNPSVGSGMYFVELPFEDDLRSDIHSSESKSSVNQTLESQIQQLVNKFRYLPGFNPEHFPNPAIAQSVSILESVALDNEPELFDMVDTTKPNYEKIRRNASVLASSIQQSLSQIERPQPELPEAKKVKPMAMQEFIEAFSIDRLHLFTVPELRWALREQGLIPSGRKDELVDRLSVHFTLTLPN